MTFVHNCTIIPLALQICGPIYLNPFGKQVFSMCLIMKETPIQNSWYCWNLSLGSSALSSGMIN